MSGSYPDHGDPPVRIPLPAHVGVGCVVYFRKRGPSPPPAGGLKPLVIEWLEEHAAEPLREELKKHAANRLQLEVHPRDRLPEPLGGRTCCLDLDEGELDRFRRSDNAVMVLAADSPGASPPTGLWSVLGAGCAVTRALDGLLLDIGTDSFVPPRFQERKIPAHGEIRVIDHLKVLHSVSERGLAWVTTKGLSKFGLPELEVNAAPPGLGARLGHVLNGLAQRLLSALGEPVVKRGGAPAELVVGPEIELRAAEVALALGPEGESVPRGGSALLRLSYAPGSRGSSSFLTVLPPRGFPESPGVWHHELVQRLLGAGGPSLVELAPDRELEEARRKAVSLLPAVKLRFQQGLPRGSALMVRARLP